MQDSFSMNSEQQELAQIFWNANRLLIRMSDYEIKYNPDAFTGNEYETLQAVRSKALTRIQDIDKVTGYISASTLTEVKGV